MIEGGGDGALGRMAAAGFAGQAKAGFDQIGDIGHRGLLLGADGRGPV